MEVKEPLLNYWYRALSSPFGIEIICSDTNSVRTALYVAKKEAKDLDLDKIKITVSPFDPAKLWLIRKEPSNEAT